VGGGHPYTIVRRRRTTSAELAGVLQRSGSRAHRVLPVGVSGTVRTRPGAAYRARCALDRGRWSEAVELAQQLLGNPRTILPRVPALVVVGLVRIRRGDPDSRPPLDEALSIAEVNGELQFTGPVAAALAEVAWLEGNPEAVAAATETALDVARKRRAAWLIFVA
jgi:hypothetical protein